MPRELGPRPPRRFYIALAVWLVLVLAVWVGVLWAFLEVRP